MKKRRLLISSSVIFCFILIGLGFVNVEPQFFSILRRQQELKIGVLGAFYGMLLMMSLYNFLLGLSLKDRNYFYFVSFILNYMLLTLRWGQAGYLYFALGSGISLLFFSCKFLQLNMENKHCDQAFKVLLAIYGSSFIALFFIGNRLAHYLVLLLSLSVFTFVFKGIIAKNIKTKMDIIFLFAWELFFAGNVLKALGVMGFINQGLYVVYTPKLSILFVVVLFSLALSEKIKESEYQRLAAIEKHELLSGLHDINKKIIETRDMNRVATYVIEHFVQMIKAQRGKVLLVDPEKTDEVQVYTDKGFKGIVEMNQEEALFLQQHMTTIGIKYLAHNDLAFIKAIDQASEWMMIPLIHFDIAIGAIVIHVNEGYRLEPYVHDMLVDYANQVTVNIGNIKLFQEISTTARTDELTRIHNRRHIFELASYFYKGPYIYMPFSILMIDIDHFKKVNDTYGHVIGDKVLMLIAKRLKVSLQGFGELGRYGGEEFMVILPNLEAKKVREICQRLREDIEKEVFDLSDEITITLTISIGIAHRAHQIESTYMLCDRADQALYQAKSKGRNRVEEYVEFC